MFETLDGIFDISGYTQEQRVEFFQKYPDAKQLLSEEDANQLLSEDEIDLKIELEKPKDLDKINFLDDYLKEEDFDREVEARLQSGGDIASQALTQQEQLVSSTIAEEEAKLDNFKYKKPKDVNEFFIENKLETLSDETFKDIAPEKTEFTDEYYKGLEGVGIKTADFEGMLNSREYSSFFKEQDEKGTFSTLNPNVNQKDLPVIKQRLLAGYLDEYVQSVTKKYNAGLAYKDYTENPSKYKGIDDMDEVYEIFVKENGVKPAVDMSKYYSYYEKTFPDLVKKEKENEEEYQEYLNNEIKKGDARRKLESIVSTPFNISKGWMLGVKNFIDFGGELATRNLGMSTTGLDASIFQEREKQMSDPKNRRYISISGKTVEYKGKKYLKDTDGNIYDTSIGLPVNETLDEKELKRINNLIDIKGVEDVDYSLQGFATQGAQMLGDIIFQIGGTFGAGRARVLASEKYLAKANGFKSASQFRTYQKMGYMPKAKNVSTFGQKMPIDARRIDAMVFTSANGAQMGYQNTLQEAKLANIKDDEAEKLANIASIQMGVLYAGTGTWNPRIKTLNNLDDYIAKQQLFKNAINQYLNTGSKKAFGESIKNGIKSSWKGIKNFGYSGTSEASQEIVQQGGETYIVNGSLNRIAGKDFLIDYMSNDDIRNTMMLSIAAGGTTNVNLKGVNFKPNPHAEVENLFKISRNIPYAQSVFNKFVDRGKLTREQADDILKRAEAIGKYQAPAWMLNTPKAYIDAATKHSEVQELKLEKESLGKEYHKDQDAKIKKAEDELQAIVDLQTEAAVEEGVEVIKKFTDKVESFDTPRQMVEFLQQKAEKEGKKYDFKSMMADARSDGFIVGDDGTIFINKQRAAETQAVSVASHELLHKVMQSEFTNNPEMNRIVEEFKQVLKNKGIYNKIDARMNVYRDAGIDVDNVENADEYFTAFSDLIAKNEISQQDLDEPILLELGRKIINIFKTRFGFKNARFETGQDVFDFIKNYQKNIKEGKLTKQAKLKLEEFVPDETKRSLSILQNINNLVPKEVKTKQDFQDAKVFNPIYEATLPGGPIYNYVNSRSTSREEAEITLEGVVDRLINFDPAAVRKTASGDPITFGEFLFANARFSKLDAKKKLAIESERRAESLDTEEARQVAEPVAETTTTEAPRVEYQNLVEANVLPAEMVSKVKDKILLITKTLKSRIDAAVSINKTVTPLMSEIKKEIGKQADIEFKKMLGAKRGGELRNNFLKLKKPILENMTTTWLMQAMPFAIQKSVDGKFTSDWEGKKIDRESVETDKAGRTSGAQLVRRLPNAANKITDEQFLTYMFKGDEVIRGRKEALAKALAEEYAFDVYSQELQDPKSEIREAFKDNQERLGVQLADNIIQEFSRQAERGNVKRSISDISNTIDVYRTALELHINDDIDGAETLIKSLNMEDQNRWETITGYLSAKNYKYKKSLENLDAPGNVSSILKTYFANKSDRDNDVAMKQMYDFSSSLIDALPNSLVKALGVDFFGVHLRYLNPKPKNSYGDKIREKIKSLDVTDTDTDIKVDDIRLVQAGSGIVLKITNNILNKEFKSADEKINQFESKYGDEVRALNSANREAIETIFSTVFDLAIEKPQQVVGFLRMLESTTNIAKSLRALTGIMDIQMTAESQAVYINKKTGQGYTNTAKKSKAKEIESGEVVINTKHPNYKEALEFMKKGSKQSIDQLLRIKGEHAKPSSNFNSEAAINLIESLSIAISNPGNIAKVKQAFLFNLKNSLQGFNQQLNTKVLSDIQDAKLGTTSDIGEARLLAVSKKDLDSFYDISGTQRVGKINRAILDIFNKSAVEKRSKLSTMQKAINNSRKRSYSENPKGISVYDFDDTLAFSKSGVRYTAPNTSGKSAPQRKAILLMGSSGAGKSTIIDKLGLRKKGFKYVNQDVALDWLTKNSGLPKNMNEFTREQAQKWRELQYEAAGAAKDKASMLRGKGDGVVIDSPGGDIRKVSREFKDAGYDVQVIFVNTSLENALARNKARGERRLSDTAVKNSWEKVQKSIKGTKELVDVFPKSVKEFVEINTDNIKQGEDLPSEFIGKINSFTDGYVKGRINAEQFAAQGEALLADGAEFDFSEFNKVVEGEPGPLIPRIQKAIDKFGNKNIFILTARPVAAESAIHTFMKGLGIDIPRTNITGLANSTAQAKADWMVGKVAEGYNDFYFVDDAIKNVKAVKDVLETFDVKSKVQQAIADRKRSMSSDLNEMIERNKGVRAETTYSKVLARKKGAKKGKFKFFVPYSAEDFKGLTSYTLAGKGKQGEADQRFFERNLIIPYTRGIAAMEGATQALKNDYKNLLNMFGLKKQLPKKIGDTDFTTDQAIRVYLWDQQGFDIPNISKRDQNKLSKLVAKDPDLVGFAEGLMAVSKKDQWVNPKEHWDVGSILKDLSDITDNVNRKEYLAEFIENVDEMFDQTTLNKLEAIYGTSYVDALQDSIRRMKSGSNAPRSAGKIEQKWLNWVNNSVGTIMFFNRRSALLQMLSFTNFINWSDNNPYKAAVAFGNQPLYWKKWVEIFNSDKLKERRGGLKSDIQESEIANQARNSKDKAAAVVSYLLKIGFTPTQIADSFAIATGGATFLINRTKKYEKQGLSKKEAEAKAFEDFGRISDETQQSGDPMLISQQQSSHLGRLILAFQNTPMQYTRLMKKAGKDIYNRRGSDVENLSKIAYYGFVQNLIFSSLQSALFALIPGFDDEEEEDADIEDKAIRTANSMVDTILRGSGLAGAVVATLKNAIMRYQKEDKKGAFKGDHTYTMLELANISPPIGSKLRKVYSAIQTKKFNQAVIDEMGYDLTIDGKFNPSPNYEIIANISSAAANVPADRLLSEVKSINEAFDSRNTSYQRLALALGWRTWDVNVKNEEQDLIKIKAKAAKKEAGKRKAKETRRLKKKRKLDRVRSMTDKEMEALRAESSRKREEARQRILAQREK